MIVANLDKGLPPKQKAILDTHLQDCPKCRQLSERTSELLTTLREDVPDTPDEEFWNYFETGLQARLQEQERRLGWLFPWGKVGLLAAAVLVLAIGLKTLMPYSPQYAKLPPSSNMVIQELYAVYGPLSEDVTTVDYDQGDSEYERNLDYLSANGSVQLFDDEDDLDQLFL